MTTLSESITKMRRFLRDPDGLIWTDEDLRLWFNEAQFEIVQKISFLTRVETHFYPPQFTYAYLFNWEREYLEGDEYLALSPNQASGDSICYPWESAYWMETDETIDDGARLTQPWESAYLAPADGVPIQLHHDFNRMRLAAYDNVPITPLSQRELGQQDRFYKTRTGKVTNYYRPDEEGNLLVPYPRPSTVVFQDFDLTDMMSDTGGMIIYDEAALQENEIGLVGDFINSDDALLFIYEAFPNELEELTETPDIPSWLVRIVEHATLERAFGADTDGFIPSLRDYWKARKDIGLAVLKKYKRLLLTDRDFRLGGSRGKYVSKHPTLGEYYPRQCP